LLDERARAAYDRELAGGELVPAPPGIDAELGFRVAEELMARGQWALAAGHVKAVITRSPGEADYHAALGWAEWKAGGELPEAADAARPHLNQALAINPDHAAAHDYKGRISATLRGDDAEALFHLERAVDLDPLRGDAVAAIEELLVERGELRRYEKVLKRLLFRLRGKGSAEEIKAWLRLAELYFEQLDDPKAGAAAVASARRISPQDGDVLRLAQRAAQRIRRDTLEPIRAECAMRSTIRRPVRCWSSARRRRATSTPRSSPRRPWSRWAPPTPRWLRSTIRQRVRGAAVPASPLDRDHWGLLRHHDDGVELGAMMELVAPAVHALAPISRSPTAMSTPAPGSTTPTCRRRSPGLHQVLAELLGVPPAPVVFAGRARRGDPRDGERPAGADRRRRGADRAPSDPSWYSGWPAR